MGRLRQLYPSQYTSSGNIGTEFESLVRYLNSAELGNKTLAELLSQLFDSEGKFDGPIEFRYDATTGLEYRVGDYPEAETGWTLLVTAGDLRGTPGIDAGSIGAPIFQSRADFVAVSAQTQFDYSHVVSDDLLVYRNGLLLRPLTEYTSNAVGGTFGSGVVTTANPMTAGDKITIFKVRSNEVTAYTRVDALTVSSQAVFPFVQDDGASLIVYKNGVLQREGTGNDYIANPLNDTITFFVSVPPGNLVTIMNIQNASDRAVTGLMLESNYTDIASGLILFNKIAIASNAIPADKVAGLTALSADAARITVGASAPGSPAVGRLWLDTSPTPNQLKFWDGSQWLRTSPPTSLPTFTSGNALQFVRVNGSGTSYELGSPDLSGLIPTTQKAAASGVATLDSTAHIPASQLPVDISRRSISNVFSGAVANGAKQLTRVWNEKLTIDAFSLRLSAGTCSVQLSVNGVLTGPVIPVTVSALDVKIGQGGNTDTPIVVDATSASRAIGFTITSAAGASDLDIALGVAVNL